MFTLISYLWLLFILTVLIAPMVVGIMSRPKRVKGPKKGAATEESQEAPVEEQVPDFGDEFAEMDSK